MKKWERALAEDLRATMKYCFPITDMSGGTTYPNLDDSEFYGIDDQPGFIDGIKCCVSEQIRKAFFSGYASGAIDAVADAGLQVDLDLNKQGAWKAWEEFEK